MFKPKSGFKRTESLIRTLCCSKF